MNGASPAPLPWEDAFLKALTRTGEKMGRVSPTIAADFAQISRTLAYRRRKDSPDFRKRWDEIDLLWRENDRQRRLRRASTRPFPDDIQ